MFGLLGPNGAGKTTLMKIIGYLPQDFSMYANMTAYDALDYLAIALIFCLISPAVIGYSNLDTAQAARVMEMYFSITGMLVLSAVFFIVGTICNEQQS